MKDSLDPRELNILQRLAAVQGELDYIQKTKPKAGLQYSYVSHDQVTAAVRPLMVRHGVVYYPSNIEVTQDGNRTQCKMDVVFANVDDRADFITVATLGYGIDGQDKGPGKAISYCMKYAVLKTLSLETGDDPDHDQNVKHEPGTDLKFPVWEDSMTKAEANPEYKRLEKGLREIRDHGTLEDLKMYWDSNYPVIRTLPGGWRDLIAAEKDDVKDKLTAKAA